MSEVLKQEPSCVVPVPVVVAAIAIITTRCLSVALEVHEMGLKTLLNVIHLAAQSWSATLIFIASQLIFFVELRCALALLDGRRWGRWGYGCSQLIVIAYLLTVSAGWASPGIFTPGGEQGQLLLSQKLPDLLVLILLFLPASSRDFFQQR
ncbi:YbjO family protein [Erwinia sp.]|uniref:YbjO family protein n=1 Tax=Erwinia citreus TaxID=558 RepID=UPI00289AA0FF|nr:YbjO family protein [Erwinia sp.]